MTTSEQQTAVVEDAQQVHSPEASTKEQTCVREMFSGVPAYEYKQLDDGTIVRSGYIATTHLDRGFYDDQRRVWIRDTIAKETLDTWCDLINNPDMVSRKVTYRHVQEPEIVGVGVKGSARVDSFGLDNNGKEQYGLWASTLVNAAHPLHSKIVTELKNGVLDSFSIEYATRDYVTNKPLENSFVEEATNAGFIKRTLLPGTYLKGWTLAAEPMNEYAVMVKEMYKTMQSQSHIVINNMEETNMSNNSQPSVEQLQAELKELSARNAQLETKMVELKTASTQEITGIVNEFKEFVKSIKTQTSTPNINADIKPEYKEYTQAINDAHLDSQEIARLAGRVYDVKEFGTKFANTKAAIDQDFSNVRIAKKEGKYVLETKGLSLGDNTNSSYVNATSSIGISQAELQDVMLPVIFSALNEITTTWDYLAKDNMAGMGTNRVLFALKTGNTGAIFTKGNTFTETQTARTKYAVEFKKVYIGGSVDGDLQAASRGSPVGEALTLEIADRALALKTRMNQALFEEFAGNFADVQPMGLPAITDSAGNTTLYNTTRSAANKLGPDSAGNTYVSGAAGITRALLRAAVVNARTEGSSINDLFFVTTYSGEARYKELFDAAQRTVPYSTQVGYERCPDFEGVPVFGDKDCKAGSFFLVDRQAFRVAIFVPPTVEMLGLRSDSREFFIKSYYATYCTRPRAFVEIYSVPNA